MTRLRSAHLLMGAGGDARGMHEAGYEVVGGINHKDTCVKTARANWPAGRWFQQDATQFPMELLPEADVHFGGVVCTEVARTAGRRSTQRLPGQDAIPTPADEAEEQRFKLTAATAWCTVRAVEVHLPRALVVENVPDFATRWRPFPHWRGAVHCFDYRSQVISLNAAHVAGPDNPPADSWRSRTFIVFTRLDVPEPDLEHRPTAWCPSCDKDVTARQAWSTPLHAGDYGDQYHYVCGISGCGRRVEPYAGAAANAFDLDNIGERIGGPRIKGRTLVPATIARCQQALDFLQDPRRSRRRIPGGGWRTDINGRYHAVVEMRNHCAGASIHEPLSTICAQGRHHMLLTAPEGWKPGIRLDVADAHARSIYPPEQVRAMRFPAHHTMAATSGEDLTLLAGNAIPPNLAHFIGNRLTEVLT